MTTTDYQTTPRYQDVSVGDELPVLEKQAGEVQLFMFSASTWDTHRTHWDIPYSVEEENLPGALVHGHLQGAWLSQLLSSWAMPEGRLISLNYQNRGMAIQDEKLFVKAKVTEKKEEAGKGIVTFDTWVEKESGEISTTGKGAVELPLRG